MNYIIISTYNKDITVTVSIINAILTYKAPPLFPIMSIYLHCRTFFTGFAKVANITEAAPPVVESLGHRAESVSLAVCIRLTVV